MRKLPRLFHAIALGVIGCAAHRIDRTRFTQNLCDKNGSRAILAGIKPAAGIDGIELREDDSGRPHTTERFGTLCATAKNLAACMATVDGLHRPNVGWLSGAGDVFFQRRYVVATHGDEVEMFVTPDSAKKVLLPIDTPSEAAFVAAEGTGHRVVCGTSAAINDGSIDILSETGSGCGENDDRVLHVTTVHPDGSHTVSDTELLEAGNPNCVVGRRPQGLMEPPFACRNLGEFFADMARLEAASIVAFERLADELRMHGAPQRLIRAATRSARDERRHARLVAELAREHGRGRIPVEVEPPPLRSLEEVAIENAIEGCVRETFGAVVAAHQAIAARHPRIARVMRQIARDEARHAELAWEIADWVRTKIDPRPIDVAMERAIRTLRASISAPVCKDAVELAGFPAESQAHALLDGLSKQLWGCAA